MNMHTVETTFMMSYTDDQYVQAKACVEDMKKAQGQRF
jgi:hypothetical protein